MTYFTLQQLEAFRCHHVFLLKVSLAQESLHSLVNLSRCFTQKYAIYMQLYIISICRSIASRRFFFLIGTLYLYRCVTMYITTLPVPGMHMTCAPKVRNVQPSERASAAVAQPCTTEHPLGLCLHSNTREAAIKKKRQF